MVAVSALDARSVVSNEAQPESSDAARDLAEARLLEGVWVRSTRVVGEEVRLTIWRYPKAPFLYWSTFEYKLPFVGRTGTPTEVLLLKLEPSRKSLALPLPRTPKDRSAGSKSSGFSAVEYRLEGNVLHLDGEYDLGFRKLSIAGQWRKDPKRPPEPPKDFSPLDLTP